MSFCRSFAEVRSAGSVRFIGEVPIHLKKLYKTAWEIDMELLLRHTAARGPFVCHSQSVVLYKEKPSKTWLVGTSHSGNTFVPSQIDLSCSTTSFFLDGEAG